MGGDALGLDGVPEFHVIQPTRVVAGTGALQRLGDYAASYGSRALLVVGDSHARASGLLARVEASLISARVLTELLEGIPPNPTVAAVDAGATLARACHAQVVIAVGGGSVIDAAKAIATAAAFDGSSTFRTHLSGIRPIGMLVDSALPVVAVPTLPGSGSETNGTSVITDDETGRKLSAHEELATPRLAILDPELALEAPPELLGPALVDAFCHALEAGLSVRASIASDALAEQALRMLVRETRSAGKPKHPDRTRALLACWWASNLAAQALTLAGSIVTHPLAHPLSARLDAHHGAAVAALEPAVVAAFGDRFAESGSLQKVAGWLDVRRASDPDHALVGVLSRLGRISSTLHVRESVADLGLVEPLVQQVVRDARESGSRGLSNIPGGEPDPHELFEVLDLARAAGPATPPRRLIDELVPEHISAG